MRVLFYLADKHWSGTTRAALVAARGLAARGHSITVACCGQSRLEREASAAAIDVIPIDAAASAIGSAFDTRKVLGQKFIEAAIVTSERDHLIVASAMRFAERGGVLRRIASFDAVELQRGGKLALK